MRWLRWIHHVHVLKPRHGVELFLLEISESTWIHSNPPESTMSQCLNPPWLHWTSWETHADIFMQSDAFNPEGTRSGTLTMCSASPFIAKPTRTSNLLRFICLRARKAARCTRVQGTLTCTSRHRERRHLRETSWTQASAFHGWLVSNNHVTSVRLVLISGFYFLPPFPLAKNISRCFYLHKGVSTHITVCLQTHTKVNLRKRKGERTNIY